MKKELLGAAFAGVLSLGAFGANAANEVVSNGDDSGPGSFRGAVEAANSDPDPDSITFDPGLEVTLLSPVVYSGSRSLVIQGNGSVVTNTSDPSDLFVSDGGAELSLNGITFRDSWARGVVVDVPGDATGYVSVSLDQVTISDNQGFGLHIDDGAGSDAGILLMVHRSTFEGNGVPANPGDPLDDQDALRVDERGEGDIDATFHRSGFTDNIYDAVELDEGGAGDVFADVRHSNFDRNGNVAGIVDPDVEDGFDIDEAGAGDIHARFVHSTATGNYDEGIDLDEEDDGSIMAQFVHVEANGNADEGIKLTESEQNGGDGDVVVKVNASETSGNGGDGIKLEEFSEGDLKAAIQNAVVSGNDDGLELEEAGEGDLQGKIVRSDFTNNGDEGIALEETGAGELFVRIVNSQSTDNGGDGVKAKQKDDGTGTLRLQQVTLTGNGEDDPQTEGVSVIRKGRP